jgi:hypothetical protein
LPGVDAVSQGIMNRQGIFVKSREQWIRKDPGLQMIASGVGGTAAWLSSAWLLFFANVSPHLRFHAPLFGDFMRIRNLVFPNPFIGEAATGVTPWLIAAGTHIGFGMGLFYGIKKFFEEVEKPLKDSAEKDISAWLLDLKPTKTIRNWQSTFLTMFNKVFGEKHWTWKCFWRSCAFTVVMTLVAMLVIILLDQMTRELLLSTENFPIIFATVVFGSVLPDYLSLWKTRNLIALNQTLPTPFFSLIFLILDIIMTFFFAFCALSIGYSFLYRFLPIMYSYDREYNLVFRDLDVGMFPLWFIAAFFGRLWFLGYVSCGLLLKCSRRLDIGFRLFNHHFDIETHPLQSIGVVGGSLTALGYWFLAIVHLLP